MNRSMFRLLTTGFSILIIALFAGSVFAQGKGGGKGGGGGNGGGGEDPPASPFNYRVELVDFPAYPGNDGGSLTDIAMIDDGSGESLFVVGATKLVTGEWRGWVYDHHNNNFIDVHTLLGLDEQTWTRNTYRAISNTGIVVGLLRHTNGESHGIWFDLLAADPTPHFLADTFPEIVDGSNNRPLDVNVNGDVLTANHWIVNIFDGSSQRLPQPFLWGGGRAAAISDAGDVIGYGQNGALRFNIHTQVLEEINEVAGGWDINNQGKFCGEVDITVRKNKTRTHAFRWDDGPDFDWLSDADLDDPRPEKLNDSDDVVGTHWALGGGGWFHYSERDANGVEIGATYLIKDLVNDPVLNDSTLGNFKVTERDNSLSTPAPIIVGSAHGADEYIFILIPQELP